MDTSQWIEHLISAAFGGAGGLAAGIAKLSSFIGGVNRKLEETDRRLTEVDKAVKDLHDAIDKLRADLVQKQTELRSEQQHAERLVSEHQANVQRSIGSLEGTLNMLSQNGCARGCANAGSQPAPGKKP